MTRHSTYWVAPLLLGLMAVPGSARAEVTWTATFENNDYSEWMPGINETNGNRMNAEVVSDPVYSGMHAGKITVHPDDLLPPYNQNRVDIQHQSTLTDEGADSWISGHYLMLEDAKVRNEIWFYESNNSYSNVMDCWVEPKQGGGTSVSFGVGFLGETVLWTGDFTIGAWHQIAIHVHWSTDANVGSVDVWFDGEQVVNAVKAKTKADGNSLFFQTGLHRKDPSNDIESIYFDDFIEADNFAEAMIMAPMVPGAGGAGGAGGTAGAGGEAAGGGGAGGATAGAGGMPASAGVAGTAGGGSANAGASTGGTAGQTTAVAGAAGSSALDPNTSSPAASSNNDSGGCALSAASPHDAGRFGFTLGTLAALGLLLRRRRHS